MRENYDIDFSTLPSRKKCGECKEKKDIKCFYISKCVSSARGKISFYAATNCKECHGKKAIKRRQNWTPEQREAHKLYQYIYHQKYNQRKILLDQNNVVTL